ncbi:MAG: redoxin domain-containing protein [Thaumarchaeota archaeon]|nr:redoxin domain-containing protein [Nitrososphaerota archaeon]
MKKEREKGIKIMAKVEVGQKAPDFTLYDTERKQRKLSEFMGKKTVIAFFPGAFTGICTREACKLRDDLSKLQKMGAQIVGISVDSPFANKGFADANKLSFPFLSDYGRQTIAKYGLESNNFAGLPNYLVAKRSIFITDKDGIVRFKWVTDDPGIEPNYEEISKALASIK